MKANLFKTGLIIAATISAISCMAQSKSLVDQQIDSLLNSHKFVYVDGRPQAAEVRAYVDSVRQQISAFYYDQFRHFSDPAAPYFLFLSKDAQLAMGIGGCVRMRGYYDWGGAIPASAFAPYLIPMQPDLTNMRHIGTTPAGTALFFRVLGRNKALGDYQLYIECNFNGYEGRDFHLKKAYAIVNDFTIGYANSTFSDPAAVPPTVDANGPNNKLTPTSVLVRYMPTFHNRWTVALSVESPEPSIAVDNQTTKSVSAWLPDFAAFGQYQWAPGQHVRLAGIVRTLSYRDMLSRKNYNTVGWGLQLSSVAHPLREVTTYATVNYGHGYQSLGGDLQVGRYDLVGNPDHAGRLYAPASLGWCVGVQYNFRPNLFMSVSASEMRYLPSRSVSADEYKYGLFGCINLFWNLTPRIQIAAEYDLGKRQNFSGHQRIAQRVGALAQFSF
ncbi:MAG: hypothetical protein NC343_01940 [Muribaculum sp.]|nr:hypothetical protein [Muribaculaceae bacterium]MCM1080497.1 hypothetical protein [Muribaculum sp.]